MKYFFLCPPPFCPLSRGHKKNIWCMNTARMWCCNTFWAKWVNSYSWRAKMFYWWTVSLCLIEANHVTTAGLCLSLYLATRGKGSLYFLGYCMLVDLFYQLFMMKCERKHFDWLKKTCVLKSDFQTTTLIIITVLQCCPCPYCLPYLCVSE